MFKKLLLIFLFFVSIFAFNLISFANPADRQEELKNIQKQQVDDKTKQMNESRNEACKIS
jgi:hypothetical protein